MSSFTSVQTDDNQTESKTNSSGKCVFCGQKLVVRIVSGVKPRYCGPSCRTQACVTHKVNKAALALLESSRDQLVEQMIMERVEQAQAPLLDVIDGLVTEIARMKNMLIEVLAA